MKVSGVLMRWSGCTLVARFLHLSATSSFTLSNITILTFSSVPFSIRLTHFPNLIGAFDFTLWPSPRIRRYVCVPHPDLSYRRAHMECLSLLVRFCRYMNVPIASAQDCRGSPKLCDIAQVPLVVMLFSEGEYGTNKMIQMSCSSQSPFIRLLPAPLHGRTSLFWPFCSPLDWPTSQIQLVYSISPSTGHFHGVAITPSYYTPNWFPSVSSRCLQYVVLVMFYLCGMGEAAGGGRTTSTCNLDSPPPGLSDGLAVNWRHGCLTFVEHNISGLLHSQLGDPHLITTFVLVSSRGFSLDLIQNSDMTYPLWEQMTQLPMQLTMPNTWRTSEEGCGAPGQTPEQAEEYIRTIQQPNMSQWK